MSTGDAHPVSANPEAQVIHATPKLVNALAEVKRTMLPSEWDFMREVRRAVQRGAFIGFLTGTAVSLLVSRTAFRKIHPLFRIPLGMAATSLFTVAGGMTVIPHMVRRGLFTLPDDSQLKMAMLHVIQLNNPSLSPQQLWSLIRKQRSFKFTEYLLESPTEVSFLPIPPVYVRFRPMYDDPAYVHAMELLESQSSTLDSTNALKIKTLQPSLNSEVDVNNASEEFDFVMPYDLPALESKCASDYERKVLRAVAENKARDDAFRLKLRKDAEKGPLSIHLTGVDPVKLYQKSELIKQEHDEMRKEHEKVKQ